MEVTLNTFYTLLSPSFAFIPGSTEDQRLTMPTWNHSFLNPKNRVDSLRLPTSSKWELHGIDPTGTRFFALPVFALGKPPLRIDVYIPSHDLHPPSILHGLQSNAAIFPHENGATSLDISHHILIALESWSSGIPDFEEQYMDLAFGSRIVINYMRADARDMGIQLIPIFEVEQQWLSAKSLQALWKDLFPDWTARILDIQELQLQRQPHDALSLVTIPRLHGSMIFAFKSLTRDVKYLYHELKLLLSMGDHEYIISKPVYVITKKCRYGNKVGVCGFATKYYPLGTLRGALSCTQKDCNNGALGIINLGDRLRWARELTSTLIHIQKSPMGYYSDLKPDNVLLTRDNDSLLHTKLIDFEQKGGWHSFSPPEIYYIEYLETLASTSITLLPLHISQKFQKLLQAKFPDWKAPGMGTSLYRNPQEGYNIAWSWLDRRQRERAQVFMLGKLLWCIFEDGSSVNSGIGTEMLADEGVDHLFPGFRRTPEGLKECIRMCTKGALEWEGRFRCLRMVERKLFAAGGEGRFVGEGEESVKETREAVLKWWKEEVENAERFLAGIKVGDNDTKEHGVVWDKVMGAAAERLSLQDVLNVIEQLWK